jgi:6-pyruvoyltetrahydropterin/6-carboxytetrahydropterin synthase
MPGKPPPEGEPHHHDYRFEVVVARERLDEQDMVCDLDVLEAALGAMLARIEDQDLEMIRPPEAAAVTVEVLARWAHDTLADTVRKAGAQTLSVRVWESPEAFGGYSASIAA